jgi:hypothetical protein
VSDPGGNGRRGDPIRLLHAQSQHGYTDRIDQALPEEPEAVSAEEQRRMTELARRRDGQRRRAAYVALNATVNAALDGFVAVAGKDPKLAHAVRAVRRTTAAVRREVGTS